MPWAMVQQLAMGLPVVLGSARAVLAGLGRRRDGLTDAIEIAAAHSRPQRAGALKHHIF